MPWYLYLALKQLFPSKRWLSFFSSIAIIGVALGVMVLVVVLSVMNGLGEAIRKKMVDMGGHIRIEAPEQLMATADEVCTIAQDIALVEVAEPYAMGVVMLEHDRIPAFPVVKGLDVTQRQQIVPIDDYLVLGNSEALDDRTLFLGAGLARKLGASVGSEVDLYTPLMIDRLKSDEVLLPRSLTVSGIFETGWNQIDANTVIVTLRLMQELYGLGEDVHGVMVKLKDGKDLAQAQQLLKEKLGNNFQVSSWLELNRDFLSMLWLEKTILFFIIIFITLVASFSIASSLMTTVVRKQREIGLLGALGALPRHIAYSYCCQGLIIGLLGTVLGMLGAALGLYFRNGIVHGLARLAHREDLILKYYQFSDIPVHYMLSDLCIIALFAVMTSTLASALPAWRVSRLKPTEALRNE